MKTEAFKAFPKKEKKAIRQHKHFLGLRKQSFKSVYFFTYPRRKYKTNLFFFCMQKASKIKRFEQFLFPNYLIKKFGPKRFLGKIYSLQTCGN